MDPPEVVPFLVLWIRSLAAWTRTGLMLSRDAFERSGICLSSGRTGNAPPGTARPRGEIKRRVIRTAVGR